VAGARLVAGERAGLGPLADPGGEWRRHRVELEQVAGVVAEEGAADGLPLVLASVGKELAHPDARRPGAADPLERTDNERVVGRRGGAGRSLERDSWPADLRRT
jgi:hypothetical protein